MEIKIAALELRDGIGFFHGLDGSRYQSLHMYCTAVPWQALCSHRGLLGLEENSLRVGDITH